MGGQVAVRQDQVLPYVKAEGTILTKWSAASVCIAENPLKMEASYSTRLMVLVYQAKRCFVKPRDPLRHRGLLGEEHGRGWCTGGAFLGSLAGPYGAVTGHPVRKLPGTGEKQLVLRNRMGAAEPRRFLFCRIHPGTVRHIAKWQTCTVCHHKFYLSRQRCVDGIRLSVSPQYFICLIKMCWS